MSGYGEAFESEPGVVEVNFGHPSNVIVCELCDIPLMMICLDGTIHCGNPNCMSPMPHRWFLPAPELTG